MANKMIQIKLSIEWLREAMIAQTQQFLATEQAEVEKRIEEALKDVDVEAMIKAEALAAVEETVRKAVQDKLQRIVRAQVESLDIPVKLDERIDKEADNQLGWAINRIVEGEVRKFMEKEGIVDEVKDEAAKAVSEKWHKKTSG